MKKFLSLILIAAFTFASTQKSMAQITLAQTDPAGATSTVNTNADTSYHTVSLAGQTFNYEIINFTLKGTKTSGTVAGAATLWGSNDNSNWFAVYAKTNASTADTTTSQTLTDGNNNFCWIISRGSVSTAWRYYRVRVITSGTQVSAYTVYMLGRKVPN